MEMEGATCHHKLPLTNNPMRWPCERTMFTNFAEYSLILLNFFFGWFVLILLLLLVWCHYVHFYLFILWLFCAIYRRCRRVHLSKYDSVDRNKSLCYFYSLVTFICVSFFFLVAIVQKLKNILCSYSETVIGEFQKTYKTAWINCNEFLLLLNFSFFLSTFSFFLLWTCK